MPPPASPSPRCSPRPTWVSERPRVVALLGPTGVGKTALAVDVCTRLGGEVVSADSRQIYQGLRIGSAAPSDEELAAAPHHLIGFLDPRRTWSVAEFVESAEAAIAPMWCPRALR